MLQLARDVMLSGSEASAFSSTYTKADPSALPQDDILTQPFFRRGASIKTCVIHLIEKSRHWQNYFDEPSSRLSGEPVSSLAVSLAIFMLLDEISYSDT
jgi:hypothetical protein